MRALLAVIVVFLALPAAAERPADVLARLRGTPSTNAGALGSDFPLQYVEAYRCVPRPRPCLHAPHPHSWDRCGRACGAPSTELSVTIEAGPVLLAGTWTSRSEPHAARSAGPGSTPAGSGGPSSAATASGARGTVLAPAQAPRGPARVVTGQSPRDDARASGP